MTADKSTEKPLTAKPILLETRQAYAIGIGGIMLMVCGVVAVYETDSEAGPVALLALGLLFFIIGVAR